MTRDDPIVGPWEGLLIDSWSDELGNHEDYWKIGTNGALGMQTYTIMIILVIQCNNAVRIRPFIMQMVL